MRPPRLDLPDYPYHIFNRGNNKARIFHDNEDRSYFLGLLRKARKRFDFLLHAWTLMDNHFHFLLEPLGLTRTSTLMHWVQLGYARHFQRRYKHVGHVFQSRYNALIVEKDRYFLTVERYIHLNPVRAGMVLTPEQYTWSSYRARIHNFDDGLTTHHTTLAYFGTDHVERLEEYREFTFQALEKEEEWSLPTLQKMTAHGTQEYLARISRTILAKPDLVQQRP